MTTNEALELANRQLAEVAHLKDDAFWREYCRIEDAALLRTEPSNHGVVMKGLDTYLLQLGKVSSDGDI